MIFWIIGIAIIGYAIGCLHGSVVAQWISGVNLKETGVKNAGASNALIVLGKRYGALVAIIDIGKGILAVLAVRLLSYQFDLNPEYSTLLLFTVGAAVIFGHNFPFYMKFNGGKGTATVIGVLFAIDWRFGLAGLVLFIAVALLTDILVIGVFMLYVTLMAMAIWLDGYWPILIAALLFIMAVWKHTENIKRIRAGTETRIRASFSKKKEKSS
ncbi:glycerol-3-phosphate acyltransferase [Sporosarcina sp. NCCP-2222]|uniref:glycerol-3-phosphate acyltransferase n=1 Tax=Sporosarcina sp. NCCP-2222 TaxID=2935073 RepID=UPI0020896A7F|nr:glycerol-3-phosphate acyltransferase [Sporosarcina sp. NCCP-2222]GKV56220.1 glycerol-3-phosphate acyltransferase [Sporosarcina sp. NCCP-2222]